MTEPMVSDYCSVIRCAHRLLSQLTRTRPFPPIPELQGCQRVPIRVPQSTHFIRLWVFDFYIPYLEICIPRQQNYRLCRHHGQGLEIWNPLYSDRA
jgi:hypothetical protein